MKLNTYIFWIGIVLSLLLGALSHFIGQEISLKLFYLLVIGMVTWLVGKREGLIVTSLAIALWLVNLYAWGVFWEWISLWRTIERVVIFAVAVVILDYMRSQYVLRLHHAEERYTKIVESAIEGVIAISERNVIQYVNTPASSMLGYASAQVTGMSLLALARDEASRSTLERIAKDAEYSYCPCEIQLTRANGSALWALVNASSLVNRKNAQKETVLLLTDISERKKSEEELQRRYEQISAMQRMSFGLAESLHLNQRLQNALKVVIDVTKFDGGVIYLVEESEKKLALQFMQGLSDDFIQRVKTWEIGRGNTGISAKTGKAIFIEDAEHDGVFDPGLRAIENIHGFAAIPLFSKSRTLGMLCIIHRQPFFFSEGLRRMLQAFGNQIGFALENAKLYEAARARERDLREMSLAMVRLQEDERKRLAREIHDGLSQVLTVLKINAELTMKNNETDTLKAAGYLQEVLVLANEAETEAKRLANDLRPAILDDFGLKAAIKLHATNFERRTGIAVELHLPFYEIRFDPMIETSVYRIVQEILANVAKHANATKVTIQFLVREGILALIVADNGKGFDYQAMDVNEGRSHHGLRNMRERVEFIGGTFRVESVRNRGTEILMEIPIRDKKQELMQQVAPQGQVKK